ncbi:winged helix-turn-helix transcriptional regulator [Natrarchaeobius sp. A-rgal3]
MNQVAIDEVDRGILFLLQKDARNITIAEIAPLVELMIANRNELPAGWP